MPDRLERLKLFLDFWFSPWGAAKGVMWEAFTDDLSFSETNAHQICVDILAGREAQYDWSVLEKHDAQ